MAEEAYDLARFIKAQEGVIDQALSELRIGRKTSHWMWFVFPQLQGLGSSPTAQFYGLASLGEARDYLADATLGARLKRCVQTVLEVRGRTLHEIFGSPDDLKFRSSMTLFETASNENEAAFSQALDTLCGGKRDDRTIGLLKGR